MLLDFQWGSGFGWKMELATPLKWLEMLSGGTLERLWRLFGAMWSEMLSEGTLERLWTPFGARRPEMLSGGTLEKLWRQFGARRPEMFSGGTLKRLWRPSGAMRWAAGGPRGLPWGHLGATLGALGSSQTSQMMVFQVTRF